jgi:hypothetical protein
MVFDTALGEFEHSSSSATLRSPNGEELGLFGLNGVEAALGPVRSEPDSSGIASSHS